MSRGPELPRKSWLSPIVIIGLVVLVLVALTVGFPPLRMALAAIHGIFVPPV